MMRCLKSVVGHWGAHQHLFMGHSAMSYTTFCWIYDISKFSSNGLAIGLLRCRHAFSSYGAPTRRWGSTSQALAGQQRLHIVWHWHSPTPDMIEGISTSEMPKGETHLASLKGWLTPAMVKRGNLIKITVIKLFSQLTIIRKRGGVQKSMGNKVPWKTGVLNYFPVTLRPLISLQKEAFLSPCNFATAHMTACILNFCLPWTSRPMKREDPFATPQIMIR